MASSYPHIRAAHKRRRKAAGELAQSFHLDSRLWRLVVKELSPEAAYWLSEDLKAKGKLLFKNCLIKVDSDAVSKYDIWASFVDVWAEVNELRTDSENAWLNKRALEVPQEYFERYAPESAVAEEIEMAVVKVLWLQRAWPESLFYNGQAVSSYFISHDASFGLGASDFGFVYFIRNKDLYKIGITSDMLRRMAELKPDEVLNMVRCSNYFDVESRIHKEFSKERLPQSEYFRLSPEQVQQVHRMMLDYAFT